jgi:hypothetical protein
MNRVAILVYGALSYLTCPAVFLYLAGSPATSAFRNQRVSEPVANFERA